MNLKELRMVIRQILIEEKAKEVLGEPDSSSERHRDEPQPQYDVEEDAEAGEEDAEAEEEEDEEEEDQDEASTVGGMGGGLGPAMPLTYDPEKPAYNPYKTKNKK